MRTVAIVMLMLVAVGGCKKKPASSGSAAATPAPVDGRNTEYVAGGGAVQNTRQAAKRTVALNDMASLGQLIELQYNETGKMPKVNDIKANLTQAQNLLTAINDGVIILTGTTDHSGLWAYEVDADKAGGIILQAGSARRASKDEVKQLLGR
jgi:hypothetical protein